MSFEKDLRIDSTDGTDWTIAPGTNHGGGSQVADQDRRSADQQVPVRDGSPLTPAHDSSNPSEYGPVLGTGTDIYSPSR